MTQKEFKAELSQNTDTVYIVDLFAQWCGPCKGVMPILEQLADEFKNNVKLIKVDIEEDEFFADEYKVKSVPTVLIFKEGELVEKIVGPKTKDAYIEFVKPYIF